MRGLRKLLSLVLVAGVVLGTFSTGVSAGFYTADEEGLKDIKIDSNSFPDEIFRDFVKAEYDTNKDGILAVSECQYVREMDVSDLAIRDLKGIEYFQGLFELDCCNNALTSIDLTLNFNMQRLDISGNYISYIEIGTMPLIKRAYYKCPKTKKNGVYRYIGSYGAKDYKDDGTLLFVFDETTTVNCDYKIGWQADSHGEWFRKADGSYLKNCGKQIGGEWFYFDKSGYMVTNKWVYTAGRWYYFEADGMVANGWTKINGKWYYFSGLDWDQTTTQTSSGMQVGLQEIDSDGWKWFYFNKDGAMQTGWVNVSGKWYYFDKEGRMTTGWQEIDSKWYYMVPSEGGDRLTPPDNGYMLTYWKQIGDYWYYFGGSGEMALGWKYINGKWYYLNEGKSLHGAMRTGWQTIDGEVYYLKDSGEMATGWVKVGDYWYYMNSNGTIHLGLLNVNGKTYYLNEGKSLNGIMVTGWKEIDGEWYYFKDSGEMAKGWVKDGEYWYYMDSDGTMRTGWLVLNGKAYYLNENNEGRMCADHVWPVYGGYYEFDHDGVCQNPPDDILNNQLEN